MIETKNRKTTILVVVVILFILVGVGGIHIGLPISTVATILSAFATSLMAIFVGFSIFQGSKQHDETLKEMQTSRERSSQSQTKILEEMQESRKPILKPIVNVIKESAKPLRHTLSIKNVGLGPATEVDVWWHRSELPLGVVESEEKWPRTNPVGYRKLPPLGSNEVFDIGLKLDKISPRNVYIRLKYTDTYKKVKELYYKCDTEEMIITNISKEEWDKWMKLTKEQ